MLGYLRDNSLIMERIIVSPFYSKRHLQELMKLNMDRVSKSPQTILTSLSKILIKTTDNFLSMTLKKCANTDRDQG